MKNLCIIPAYTIPNYKRIGWKDCNMLVAEEYYSKCLALPMFPAFADGNNNRIFEKLKDFMQ